MKNRYRMGWLGLVLGSVFTVSAEATLVSRLGGAAAYDDVLDITWVTDAGLSGRRTWDDLVAWADGFSLGWADDWRLASVSVSAGVPTGATTSVVDCSSATELACRDNELGYMFYHNLGGSFGDDLTGDHTVDGVALTNIQRYHWSGTEFDSGIAWNSNFSFGFQFIDEKYYTHYGWAVHSGDALVPLPAAVWLFAPALASLGFVGRRPKRAA